MSKPTSIRCYDYVNHSYDDVRQVLASRSNEVFHQATRSSETRAENIAAGLHVKIAGIEIGKEILIGIKKSTDIGNEFKKEMTIQLEWKAAETPQLFPTMVATLHIYPITGTETQLDFRGEYQPPLGVLGKAIDAVVGRKIAEASIHHFVSEVAKYLRKNLG